eukprot:3230958-Lingulodinium_polyedra.AAC.1
MGDGTSQRRANFLPRAAPAVFPKNMPDDLANAPQGGLLARRGLNAARNGRRPAICTRAAAPPLP